MLAWNCCRTCLSVDSLYPIFPHSNYHEKYTNVLSTVAGIQVHLNDTLPQTICSPCISFINTSIKFRKKCEQNQKTLLNRLNSKDIKIETDYNAVKIEETCIDINISDEEFDYEDNVPLETFQLKHKYDYIYEIIDGETNLDDRETEVDNNKIKVDNNEIKVDNNETKVDDNESKCDSKSILDAHNSKIESKIMKNKKKTRCKRKKENTDRVDKKERVKEEIECQFCHKFLTSKSSLRNHYKIHTGFDVVCEHCGKKFITRRLLLMHCRAKHGYEKTDKCSYCEYRGSNAEQVKIHERLHTGEKPYVCTHCSAGFHRKSSYLQHVAIHLPDKNVQCDQCPARFKSITLMRIHKNRHRAPQYTFKCRVCENTFARRRNVVRHLERIHGLPPEHENIVRLKIS